MAKRTVISERPASLDSRPGPSADGAQWESEIGTTLVVFGPGRLAELGHRVAPLGRRVLLVTDRGVEASGHLESAVGAVDELGLPFRVLRDVTVNPTSESVSRLLEPARDFRPEVIVALGGGSVMDSAKALNFLLTNGGEIEDYWGFGKAVRPLLPSVAVPTTAGTGSDAQSFAVIGAARSGRKMACGDRRARFRTVILDPQVAATAPAPVIAAAAIDALSHALESFVSTRATPVSRLYSRHAFSLLDRRVLDFFRNPTSLETAGDMLLGAHFAGAAIEGSMLGAAHAAANPLTARFGVAHGVALGLVLPAVIRFNGEAAERSYSRLSAGGAAALAERVVGLRGALDLPDTLAAVDVPRDTLPELATLATREWTGTYNPRPVDYADFLEFYERAC